MTHQLRNQLLNKAKNLFSSRPILTTRPCAMASPTSYQVTHDVSQNEFFIQLEKDGVKCPEKAVLQYSYLTDNHVDLEHTGVPTEYRGKGIAKILAQAAFDHFADKKIDMRPSCTYLQKFLQDNPSSQYQDRVKWD